MRHLNEVRHRIGKVGIRNVDTGWGLTISARGWSKMARNRHPDVATLLTVFAIEKVAERAVPAESHEDTMHRNPDIAGIHRMYAPVEINGTLYRVRLTVRDYTCIRSGERTNLHALETHVIDEIKIEKRPDISSQTTPKDSVESGQITLSPERFTISMADILAKSTRQDGSAWDFSDTGVRADRSPKPKLDFEPDFGMSRSPE